MRRSRADHVEQETTVLLTATPLEGIEIGPSAKLLPVALDAEWESCWKVKSQQFGLAGGTRLGKQNSNCGENCAARVNFLEPPNVLHTGAQL